MRIAAAAWRHRRTAIAALAAGNPGDAMHHAREANWLHRTGAGDDLAFLTRLLGG